MNGGAIFVLAVTPSLFWLFVFSRHRFYRPRPMRLMVLTFILGSFAVLPAAVIEFVSIPPSVFDVGNSLGALAAVMFFIVGPVEETSKFLAMRLGAGTSSYFEGTTDGLVYAAAAAFGFASMENLFYAVQYGPSVLFVRGPLSTLAHFAFSSVWGMAWGAKREGRANRLQVLAGLIAAAGLHGLFNILAGVDTGYSITAGILLVAVAAFAAWRMLVVSKRNSPHRLQRNVPTVTCGCGDSRRLSTSPCPVCGRSAQESIRIVCSNCHSDNPPRAKYCSKCGDQFVPVP